VVALELEGAAKDLRIAALEDKLNLLLITKTGTTCSVQCNNGDPLAGVMRLH
jgi:hypothetical protein